MQLSFFCCSGIMPRRLEIRTTILGKKSDDRSKRKDANANNLYVDEAQQLLEEIEQLKSNVRLTFMTYQMSGLTLAGVWINNNERHLFTILSQTNRWPSWYPTFCNMFLSVCLSRFKRQMKGSLALTQSLLAKQRRKSQTVLQGRLPTMSSIQHPWVSADPTQYQFSFRKCFVLERL